jgi:PKD repeat protein
MSNRYAAFLVVLAASLAACGGGGDGGSGGKNKPPVARLTVTPATGAAPLAIVASGESSTDPDGTITTYAWKLGDGSQASVARVQHTYATAGEFQIELTVTDNRGASSSATATVVATGTSAVFNASTFDGATYQDEPPSGTLDSTPAQ